MDDSRQNGFMTSFLDYYQNNRQSNPQVNLGRASPVVTVRVTQRNGGCNLRASKLQMRNAINHTFHAFRCGLVLHSRRWAWSFFHISSHFLQETFKGLIFIFLSPFLQSLPGIQHELVLIRWKPLRRVKPSGHGPRNRLPLKILLHRLQYS